MFSAAGSVPVNVFQQLEVLTDVGTILVTIFLTFPAA
jgi:hypothetical protein